MFFLLLVANDTIHQLACVRLLFMAAQAPAHIHGDHGLCFCHVPYIAMAGFTINSAGDYMDLMAEINEARQAIDPHPGDRLVALPITGKLLDGWRAGIDDFVTSHAFFNTGHASSLRATCLSVTEQAIDPQLDHDLMVEWDRLDWRSLRFWPEKEKGAGKDQQAYKDEPYFVTCDTWSKTCDPSPKAP
jgi:hypothetical protein